MRGEKVGGRTSGREHCKGPLCGGSAGRQGVRADRWGGQPPRLEGQGRADTVVGAHPSTTLSPQRLVPEE